MDVYERETTFGAAISADGTVITFDDFQVGLLVQQLELNYNQSITRILELSSNRQYYVIGRPEGEIQMTRVIGPIRAATLFVEKFGNACNAQHNTLNLSAKSGCITTTSGEFARGGINYSARNVVLSEISDRMSSDDMLIYESFKAMFVGLVADAVASASINDAANALAALAPQDNTVAGAALQFRFAAPATGSTVGDSEPPEPPAEPPPESQLVSALAIPAGNKLTAQLTLNFDQDVELFTGSLRQNNIELTAESPFSYTYLDGALTQNNPRQIQVVLHRYQPMSPPTQSGVLTFIGVPPEDTDPPDFVTAATGNPLAGFTKQMTFTGGNFVWP